MALDHAVLSVHGNSREVSYSLVGSCQLVKERGLTAVLITYKRKGQDGIIGKLHSASLRMVLASFT